jgi:plasmid stability protein
MTSLVIKKLPPDIHQQLKSEAARHHRSMTQEAIVILHQALRRVKPMPPVRAYIGTMPLTDKLIEQARREGRA